VAIERAADGGRQAGAAEGLRPVVAELVRVIVIFKPQRAVAGAGAIVRGRAAGRAIACAFAAVGDMVLTRAGAGSDRRSMPI
jgi:hypothetical protein